MEIQGACVREVASQIVQTFNFMLLKDFFVTCIQKMSYSKGSKSGIIVWNKSADRGGRVVGGALN